MKCILCMLQFYPLPCHRPQDTVQSIKAGGGEFMFLTKHLGLLHKMMYLWSKKSPSNGGLSLSVRPRVGNRLPSKKKYCKYQGWGMITSLLNHALVLVCSCWWLCDNPL